MLKKLEALIKELKVDVKTTKAYVNKHISIVDERPSAMAVGFIGVLVVGTPLGLIILADIPRLGLDIKRACAMLFQRYSTPKTYPI